MKTALLFPGQGSQFVGMGRDIYSAHERVREIYSAANDILGFDVAGLSFDGPPEMLTRTDNAQPAIFVFSMAVAELIRETGAEIFAVAGHSLGEYSALTYAGVFNFERGLRLVRKRGQLMQKAGEYAPGGMAAVIGLEAETVTDICREAASAGRVWPANFNAPGQVVISGERAAVDAAMKLASGAGARMVVPLEVSGAFHTPLMQPAADAMSSELQGLCDAAVPVACNATADFLTEAASIREALLLQISGPVRWEESIRLMMREGIGSFVETGPGKVLSGLMKRIDRQAETALTGDAETLAGTLDFLKAGR